MSAPPGLDLVCPHGLTKLHLSSAHCAQARAERRACLAGYGIIAVVALVQLVRIQQRVPEYGWTTQKVFHLLNAFVCILRCVVFALRDKVLLIPTTLTPNPKP